MWALNQHENQCIFKLSWKQVSQCSYWSLMKSLASYSILLFYVLNSGQSFENSITNSMWTQQEAAMWLVLFMTCDCKWKTQNSSNETAHVFVQFSIIRGTLTVPSISSRSTETADLFSAARYRETDQTTDIQKHINQRRPNRGAANNLYFSELQTVYYCKNDTAW